MSTGAAWLILFVAGLCEIGWAVGLKYTEGFSRLWPSAVVVLGYGVAFYFLSLTLRTVPVGVAYAIWSGLGVVLVALLSWWLFGQKLDLAALLGMGLIVAGVLVMNLFSSSTRVH